MAKPNSIITPELIHQLSLGDRAAFSVLFNEYKFKLYGYLTSLMGSQAAAEDVVQDIFCTLWEKRELLGQIERIDHYIFRMAHNKAINAFKKTARQQLLIAEMEKSLLSFNVGIATPEQEMFAKETETVLSMVVNKLPAQQKKVFLLSRNEGLKYEEIAKELNISPGTVKNHMIQALKSIRLFLTHHKNSLITLCILIAN